MSRHIPVYPNHSPCFTSVVARYNAASHYVAYAAIPPDHAEISIKLACPGDRPGNRLLGGGAVLRMQPARPGLVGIAKRLRKNIVKSAHPVIPGHLIALDVPVPDTDAATIGCKCEAMRGEVQSLIQMFKRVGSLRQRRLQFLALRHILHRSGHPKRAPVLIARDDCSAMYMAYRAIIADNPVFDVVWPDSGNRVVAGELAVQTVIRVNALVP